MLGIRHFCDRIVSLTPRCQHYIDGHAEIYSYTSHNKGLCLPDIRRRAQVRGQRPLGASCGLELFNGNVVPTNSGLSIGAGRRINMVNFCVQCASSLSSMITRAFFGTINGTMACLVTVVTSHARLW